MSTTGYRLPIIALLLALVLSFGVQRVARANDTEAIIGGILAGAIVYELLDDDDDYRCRSGYYYNPPRYRRGYTIEYHNYPRYRNYPRYDCRPQTYGYGYYDYGWDTPRQSFKAYRAPSHAKPVGPPRGYKDDRPGRKYRPPRGYGR